MDSRGVVFIGKGRAMHPKFSKDTVFKKDR